MVAEICGPDCAQRLEGLAERGELTRQEYETLYAFLRQKTTDEKLNRMASIKNSVMNILARQPVLSDSWPEMPERVFDDPEQHWVIRDYALQHLFEHWLGAARAGGVFRWGSDQHARIQEVFWQALQHADQSVAGTALLALWNLSEYGVQIDRDRLAQESLALAAPGASGEITRVTALQICSLLGERGALESAVEAAESHSSVALRASAIAALGRLAGTVELPRLRQFAAETNPSIRVAAEAAVKRIQSQNRI